MDVTFTCEKCGHEAWESSWIRARDGDTVRQLPPSDVCPNCTPLSYGPITQSMMAEALCECSKACNDVEDDYYECEARFVLRLLNDGGLANDKPTLNHGCIAEDWRNWLLDLARQK